MNVDLEDLADGYNHRPISVASLARARRAAASVRLRRGDVAVDIGGGRGRHAAEWTKSEARPIVVDPARGMLQAARAEPGVVPVCGVAQALPFAGGTARLSYFHLSIHYGDWRLALDEAMRVSADGAECWIWTMGEEHHRASFLAKWFPSVGEIDSVRFPDPALLADYLGARGCEVETGKETELKVMRAGTWRAAVEARFVSTLQLLSPDELARGLVHFDRVNPDPNAPVDYVLTFDWIRAVVKPLQ